jgi:hypothetical protein
VVGLLVVWGVVWGWFRRASPEQRFLAEAASDLAS